jgi:hypothetical protein
MTVLSSKTFHTLPISFPICRYFKTIALLQFLVLNMFFQ